MKPQLAVLRPFEVVIWGENKDKPLYKIGVQAFSDDEAKASAMAEFKKGCGPIHWPLIQPTITRVDVCDGIRVTPAERQRGLFEDLADVCLGSSMDDVQGATINLLLTAVQRRAANLADAEQRWDELMGRGKQALRRRYLKETDNRDAAAEESAIAKRLFA